MMRFIAPMLYEIKTDILLYILLTLALRWDNIKMHVYTCFQAKHILQWRVLCYPSDVKTSGDVVNIWIYRWDRQINRSANWYFPNVSLSDTGRAFRSHIWHSSCPQSPTQQIDRPRYAVADTTRHSLVGSNNKKKERSRLGLIGSRSEDVHCTLDVIDAKCRFRSKYAFTKHVFIW